MNASKPKIETIRDFEPEKKGNLVWEIIKTIGGIIVFLLIFRFYIFQPFSISGSSMETNFINGEYLIVNEFTYHFSRPQRGDVVVFKHPDIACSQFVNANYINRIFLQGPCKNYIKRIIGLPGETVSIKSGKVFVKNKQNPDGFELKESYLKVESPTYGDQERTLKNDEYYVLGDNRLPGASSDSREWGALPRKNIVGKAFLILIPFDKFAVIKRPSY